MKKLMTLASAAAMLMFLSACSEDSFFSNPVGPSEQQGSSSPANVNFTVKNIVLAEGMAYSQEIIVLSKCMVGDVLVEYEVEDATLGADVMNEIPDYNIITPNPCRILAGEDRAKLTIETYDDNIQEGTELIIIRLIGVDCLQYGDEVELGTNLQLNITIEDER